MSLAIIGLIGTAITAIIAPLMAWVFKYLAAKKAADDLAIALAAKQQKEALANDAAKGTETGTINQSIDAQKAARDAWLKGNS